MLKYESISLFDAPEKSIIVHGCNARGVWGSGIAKEFAEKYPESRKDYKEFCNKYDEAGFGGLSRNHFNEKHWVGWLITSYSYGDSVDHPDIIKTQTCMALMHFCKEIMSWHPGQEKITIYSNKFNSGLFKVPWKDTENILKLVLRKFPNIEWIVCENVQEPK